MNRKFEHSLDKSFIFFVHQIAKCSSTHIETLPVRSVLLLLLKSACFEQKMKYVTNMKMKYVTNYEICYFVIQFLASFMVEFNEV